MTASLIAPDLREKVALVTGASSGLGRHFARALGRQGMRVALAARRLDKLESAVAEIRADGGTALTVTLDVTDPDSVRAAVEATEQAFGPVQVLINNAGLSITKPVLDYSVDDWDATLNTNVRGPYLVAMQVARRLEANNLPGSIINVGSILGIRPAGHAAVYAASKAALLHLTRNMALELARARIRVNAIAPGFFSTDINRALWNTPAGDALIKRIPQRRLGEFEELDGAVVLLASDASRYMTGAVIPIDGGHLVSTV